MTTISTTEPVAVSVVDAIHRGDVGQLRRILDEHPELASVRLGDEEPDGMSRSLLHVATDWPGHYPHGATSIEVLVQAGADVGARFRGPHEETPLHWAASSDDVDALVALLDAGADVDASGGVIAGGTPLGDATAFGCWDAARGLVARGASAGVFDLAALGMLDELTVSLGTLGPDSSEAVNEAFWSACHGNQVDPAQALADLGAHVDFVPGWENATPLDIAARVGAHAVIRWLHSQGAHTYGAL